jgi:hypothetical protein
MTEIEPSIVTYWKNGKWHIAKKNGKIRIFHTAEEIGEWYQRNRWRIDGLTITIPLSEIKQTLLHSY